MKLFFGIFATILLLPQASSAYFTTDQTATRLTENTAIYTVTYKFGLEGRDLYMPIGAQRGTNGTSPYLEYKFLNDDDSLFETGTSAGFVFTTDKDVEIVENQYYIPAGESAVFTLVTLLTIPQDEIRDNLAISLNVTNLPFTMTINGAENKNQLSPSELQHYRTKELGF